MAGWRHQARAVITEQVTVIPGTDWLVEAHVLRREQVPFAIRQHGQHQDHRRGSPTVVAKLISAANYHGRLPKQRTRRNRGTWNERAQEPDPSAKLTTPGLLSARGHKAPVFNAGFGG